MAVGPGWPPVDVDRSVVASGQAVTHFPHQPTKVQRPPLREQVLHRERLLDWLDARIRSRIVFVVAEAGYGKTTLVSDFARRSRVRTLWYRLDDDDRDWVTFLHYLVAAGREVVPGFAPRTAELLVEAERGPADRGAATSTFISELSALSDTATALIFDDFHLVDDASDVNEIVGLLIDHLPEQLTLVFLSRRRPPVSVARLRSRDEVAELTAADLRFEVSETERLFREAYRQPLESDVLTELQARTEGWIASLHLVRAAVRERTPAEIREFVGALTGAQGDLHDYLAEEVVGDLDDETQQFLMRTSILQDVDPELTVVVTGTCVDRARSLILSCEKIGLLERRGALARFSQRFHPLVRDFLEARLRRQIGDVAVAALHRTVARFAEPRSWRLAAYHYAAAGDIDDLHRVIATATATIMGGGEFRAVEPYLERYPPAGPNPWFDIILSRVDVECGARTQALLRARSAYDAFDAEAADPDDQAANLAIANLMSVKHHVGDAAGAFNLAQMLRSRSPGPGLAIIGRAMVAMMDATANGSLPAAREALIEAASVHRRGDQRHYLGITSLNLACLERASGDAKACLDWAIQATDLLGQTSAGFELGSAWAVRAWALGHLGRDADAVRAMDTAMLESRPLTRLELLSEAADLHSMYGDQRLAAAFLSEAESLATSESPAVHSLSLTQHCIRKGKLEEAAAALDLASAMSGGRDMGHSSRVLALRLHLAVVAGDADWRSQARSAIAFAQHQGARRWSAYAQLLEAIGSGGHELDEMVANLAASDPAHLSVLADEVSLSLGSCSQSTVEFVGQEARRRPVRWRSALRNAIANGCDASRGRAGQILDQIGESDDLVSLRLLSRTLQGKFRDPALGRGLARRIAPKVFVEDQGRVEIRVGERTLNGTRLRRKVLSLLCFILSRPSMSATRDQVLDALWPEIEPGLALNSLNQTVYFLRRVFEPNYQEDLSPGYLHHDGELVWLDRELVSARSIQCRELLRYMGPEPMPNQVEKLSTLYRGRFALDFSYDDWASAYRESLHASYLAIVEKAIAVDTKLGHHDRAIVIARRALEVDPEADRIEIALLSLYRRTGAHLAAAEQYGHYATVAREDLGVEPVPFEAL